MQTKWKSAMTEEGIAPGNLEAAWKALAQRAKFLPKRGLLGAAPNLDSLLKKQFSIDEAAANGSSVAFLAEYGEKSALFLADAHPDVVFDSIKRLCEECGIARLAVNAIKISHHGSNHNTNAALLKLVQSPSFLISTNGNQFKHPDRECLARIVRIGRPDKLILTTAAHSPNHG
jgi:hypothetical protein